MEGYRLVEDNCLCSENCMNAIILDALLVMLHMD